MNRATLSPPPVPVAPGSAPAEIRPIGHSAHSPTSVISWTSRAVRPGHTKRRHHAGVLVGADRGCGGRTRTGDLMVMSHSSCHCSTPRKPICDQRSMREVEACVNGSLTLAYGKSWHRLTGMPPWRATYNSRTRRTQYTSRASPITGPTTTSIPPPMFAPAVREDNTRRPAAALSPSSADVATSRVPAGCHTPLRDRDRTTTSRTAPHTAPTPNAGTSRDDLGRSRIVE